MQLRRFVSRFCPALVATLTIGSASVATAAVTFEGTSALDLTLVSITSDGPLTGFTMAIDSDGIAGESTLGDGTAFASSQTTILNEDPLGLGVGFDVSVEALVNGEAGLTPGSEGLAEATADQIALLTLDNQSASDVTVTFDFAYFVDAFVSTTNSNPLDDAFVFADAELLVNGESRFLFSAFGDLRDGLGETVTDFDLVTIQIAAGEFADVELFAIAGGFATSEVPVFGSLPLFLTGLAGAAFLRRRNAS
jgi:hypothetical protein